MTKRTTSSDERTALHKSIWAMADGLRGSVDGWDFKNYVLSILFYRFISDNLQYRINKNEHEAGNTDFDYALLDDAVAMEEQEGIVAEFGYFIKPSALFSSLVQRSKNNPDLDIELHTILNEIQQSAHGTPSEDDFQGLFSDVDFTSQRLGNHQNERTAKLAECLLAINAAPLWKTEDDHHIDYFGDAYEYLMQMYASQAGKSGGEFFTPQCVSELLAKITCLGKTRIDKVYDPACGSGSLLLKFAKVIGGGGMLARTTDKRSMSPPITSVA